MNFMDKVRKMLGVKDLPDDVSPFYRGAKNEREALILLKEARRRDEGRRRRAMQDIEVLDQMEEELLEEGKNETGENRKLLLARRIKEIRQKMAELNSRIENIYNKRIKIFGEHVNSLETVIELESEPLPDRKSMEDLAIKARERLEDLEKASELAEGISAEHEAASPDSEEMEILHEMEARADAEIEKEGIEEPEKEKPKKETEVRETPKDEKEEKETSKIEKEKPKTERKTTHKEKKEKGEEKPEILFEE